ncbi:MAG TPA: AAA family ATPase [Ktedonobacteraceae bacterium]
MGELTIPAVTCPVLIGRENHLATLRQLVENVRRGEARLALISGEAGVGKSRLVAGVKAYTADQGFLLLQGQCFPTDLTYPYAPLLDLLRSLIVSRVPANSSTSLEDLARDIYPLLPELTPSRPGPPLRLEPEQEKRRLFAVLATFFLHLSTQSPVLLIIEDAHWSDDTSLDFLHYLARRSSSHSLLLIVTYRQDEVRPELRSWLSQLDRERLAQEIRLEPLSRGDLDTMLSTIFQQQHTSFDMRRFLHGELLDTLYALTDGNPFFVEETLSALVAEGDIYYIQDFWNRRPLSDARIPRSIQDAVQRRTEQLSEEARHVLTLAAVTGRQFDFVLLQLLTNFDEQQLLLVMKELVSAQLVVEVSSEQFAFRHALTRRAIYTQLLARERSIFHRTIAETIEQLPATTPDAHLEDLAYHFYKARDWQKTSGYAQRAGEKALKLYAHRAAIDYLTWTLEALAHLSQKPSPVQYRTRGLAYDTLGEFEQAQHDYTLALEAAREIQDYTAEWQSVIDLGFLWAGRDYAQAETWFRQALVLSQSLNDPALHAHSLNRIGNWYLNVEQANEALLYHQEALRIFRELHEGPGMAETLDLLGMTSYLGGDLVQGTAFYRSAIALFEQTANSSGLASSLATMGIRGPTFQTDSMVSAANLAEASQDVERALRIAREIGHRSAETYALFQLGLCLGSQGEYGLALSAAQQSLSIAEEIEHRQWRTAAHTILGGIYSGMLAFPEAREHFEQAVSLARKSNSLFWTRLTTGHLASVTITQNDLTRAEKLLQGECDPEMPGYTMAQRVMWCAAVELALAQANPGRALEMIDRLFTADAQTLAGQSGLRVLKLRGDSLAALQRSAEAEAMYKAALEIASSQGARPLHWSTCVALGNLYRALERKAEAEEMFTTARMLIEELTARIPSKSLQDNFQAKASALLPGTRLIAQARGAKQTPGGLTEREREVAILIAQGNSNQMIADVLVVTKRTVETHIGNIMFKLGCTSRTQIAVWAVETGLISKAE